MKTPDRLRAVEISVKDLCKTCEFLCNEIRDIKENDLVHLATTIEGVRTISKSARFRAGVTLVGLAFIGLMIAILAIIVGIMVAVG